MSSRSSLAIIVGALGIYFLADAAFAGYGLYLATEVLNGSPPGQSEEADALREQFGAVLWGLCIFGVSGLLTLASGFGLARRTRWGQLLWIGTSGTIVLAILFAVAALGASLWSHYLFVLAGIGLSWWGLAEQRGARHEA